MTATNYETQKIHQSAREAGLSIKKDIINDQIRLQHGHTWRHRNIPNTTRHDGHARAKLYTTCLDERL